MSARFGIRAFRAQMPARQVNTNMRFAQRRTYQSVAENPNNVEAPAKEVGKLAQIWNSPVGPKTVHFWAPIMKVRCDMTFLGLSEERISRYRDYSKRLATGLRKNTTQDTITKSKSLTTFFTVGSRPRRCRRLRPSREGPLALPERCAHSHRPHLDPLVLHHQASQPVPRLSQLPPLLRWRNPDHSCPHVQRQPEERQRR